MILKKNYNRNPQHSVGKLDTVWYHVSKYSVDALSDTMRIELKPFGIDVTMIEPGGIKTDGGIIAAKHLRNSSLGTPTKRRY